MQIVVRWSWKARLGLALTVPVLGCLSAYAFLASNEPSEGVGIFAAVAAVVAALLQVPLARYRLVADPHGFSVRSLRGHRRFGWADVRKVELIGQAQQGGRIVRWASTPEDAFHVVLHTRTGRISVQRWMTGLDPLIALLRDVGVLEREDPSVVPVFRPSRTNRALMRIHDGLAFAHLLLLLPLGWIGGLMAVATTGIALSGNLFVDGTLVSLVPWILASAVYAAVGRARARRFGPDHARPPIGATDALLTVGAAVGGPLLLWGFAPRAWATRDPIEVLLLVVGLYLCWIPIGQVRTWLREV